MEQQCLIMHMNEGVLRQMTGPWLITFERGHRRRLYLVGGEEHHRVRPKGTETRPG
jgi:hypothetical protein